MHPVHDPIDNLVYALPARPRRPVDHDDRVACIRAIDVAPGDVLLERVFGGRVTSTAVHTPDRVTISGATWSLSLPDAERLTTLCIGGAQTGDAIVQDLWA
jgi:hypothetical protein